MNTLRKIVGKTRVYHVTSQDIRQQCGIHPTREWIIQGREECDNHMSGMTEDRIVTLVKNKIKIENNKKCRKT
jgi:hypothetical protein